MDYRRTYQLLIDKRRNNPLPDGEYGEVHHIVPKSEGGSDYADNLVKLTAREHYVAHLLLARIYNDASMWAALMMMSSCKGKKRQYRVSSRLYQHARSSFAEHHSKVMKQIANTPWFRSIMSKAHKGKPPHNKGKPCSEEQKEKLRQANLGKKQSKETIQKRVQKLIGQKRSEEARRKNERETKRQGCVGNCAQKHEQITYWAFPIKQRCPMFRRTKTQTQKRNSRKKMVQ